MGIAYLVKMSSVVSALNLTREIQMDINTFYNSFFFVLGDLLFKTDTLMETQNLFVYGHSKFFILMYNVWKRESKTEEEPVN